MMLSDHVMMTVCVRDTPIMTSGTITGPLLFRVQQLIMCWLFTAADCLATGHISHCFNGASDPEEALRWNTTISVLYYPCSFKA